MKSTSTPLAQTDTLINSLIGKERKRQEGDLQLIASENYTSLAVMQAQGSVLTNKYAEGYPTKRYYGGCEYIDQIEQLAINRACKLFGASYANVQPHSGAQANQAVLLAFLEPGDKIMGMALDHGGHLTHGSPANWTGRIFQPVPYFRSLENPNEIDYDRMEKDALIHKPKVLIGGYSAFHGKVDWARMRRLADEIGAIFMVDMAHFAGLVAAGAYPSPLEHAHVVTTTTHKTLRGPRGGLILSTSKDEELHKKINFSVFPLLQGGPLQHVIAGKAICFAEALLPEFTNYGYDVISNARALAKALQSCGVALAGNVIENHINLIDLRASSVSGKKGERLLQEAGITTNKNTVPDDHRSAFVTSGIRLGTAAITTRGFKQSEATQVGQIIGDLLKTVESGINVEKQLELSRARVKELTQRFPLYNY